MDSPPDRHNSSESTFSKPPKFYLNEQSAREVLGELRRVAAFFLRREGRPVSLDPTSLVNEAYLRLARKDKLRWNNRKHFLATASLVIRRVLVEHARAKNAWKRGGRAVIVSFHEELLPDNQRNIDILDLDAALKELEELSSRQSRIVQLRFLGGLTLGEIAETESMDLKTVKADWAMARSWLRRRLSNSSL
ncbi:MAG: RNA polymerase subunit sigma-70 [Planctomycetota bacterium]|nr:MAG: RNA polymerase subunit sigma-70 [Planctomycetota bacterium]